MKPSPARRGPRRGLIFGLISAERALRRWIDSRADGTPIGAAGAGVLFYLAGAGSAPINHIAQALGASAAATTGLLNRLEAAGVVEKSAAPDDGRSKLISLTAAGRELLPRATSILDDLNARVTDGFTEAELDVVQRWVVHVSRVTAEA